MNVKITYKHNKDSEDRIYKIMCDIIRKDMQKNGGKGRVETNEKECGTNEGINGYARHNITETSDRKIC